MASSPKKNITTKERAMVEEIITIFCTCDDFLKAIDHKDHVQSKINTAELLTIMIISAKYFGGNYEKGKIFLREHNYIISMIRSC